MNMHQRMMNKLLENSEFLVDKEKKKQRREDVVKYIEPKDDRLGFVKRFGHMPDFQKPIGWDGKDFRETFKTKNLPFLATEEFDWDGSVKKIENKLIWGDNLSVMRSLPSESIDLIYIDPPFFSGRNYNCIFGDDDEVRTFNDIWDGGLPTYLAWLNARLWEVKRLLKPTGSFVIHLDWHAVHYVKVELDKIFGYENFVNEIIWSYQGTGQPKKGFKRKHDTLLIYGKTDDFFFDCEAAGEPLSEKTLAKFTMKDKDGRRYKQYKHPDGSYKRQYLDPEKLMRKRSVWDISTIQSWTEKIGYPTQKPEKLLSEIISTLSKEGDLVADFFSGGGTTISVAEKLGRRWIGCDISRIAVSVARDRVQTVYTKAAGISVKNPKPIFGFKVENHGAYDKAAVRQLTEESYVNFILDCYEATPQRRGEFIHGFKMEKAVHVGPSKGKLTVDQIEEFHVELSHKKIESGVILAWSWDKEAETYIDELRSGHHGPEIQLVQVKLVDIDSHEFKGDNIRFLNIPALLP